MKLLTQFVSTALFAGSAAIASAATPLINLVGDQAPLVVSFNNVPSLVKSWGESPWAKTWDDPQVRKFFGPLHSQLDFEKADAEVKAKTGYSIENIIDFATGDAVFAITSADIDFESDDVDATFPFIAAIDLGKNASKVEALIADARKKEAGSEHDTEEFAGITLHIEKSKPKAKTEAVEGEEGDAAGKKDGPDQFVWAMADGVWLVGLNTQSVTAAIDALKKGGVDNAYGKSTQYLSAQQKNGGPSHVSFVINFRPIIARAQEEIAKKSSGEQANPFLNPAAIIPALGLDAWNALYFNVSFTDAQTLATGGFTFSEERGLLKMFSYGQGPVARPDFVPAKWLSVSSAKFSLKNFYSGLEETLGAYNPGVLGMGQMYVQQFNQQLGIDIKRDFFGSFGPDLISGYAPRAGTKTGSLDDLDQFVGFSLDNPKAFANALSALLKMGGPQVEQMIAKREFLGATINTFSAPGEPNKPATSVSYAIAKNYFMLSVGSAGAIEAALQGGSSFWERSEVKKAFSSIPGDASSFTYQNSSALIGTIFQSLAQLGSNPAMQAQSPVDASAVPNVDTVSKYWGDTVGYLTRENQGYFFKSTLEHKK